MKSLDQNLVHLLIYSSNLFCELQAWPVEVGAENINTLLFFNNSAFNYLYTWPNYPPKSGVAEYFLTNYCWSI